MPLRNFVTRARAPGAHEITRDCIIHVAAYVMDMLSCEGRIKTSNPKSSLFLCNQTCLTFEDSNSFFLPMANLSINALQNFTDVRMSFCKEISLFPKIKPELFFLVAVKWIQLAPNLQQSVLPMLPWWSQTEAVTTSQLLKLEIPWPCVSKSSTKTAEYI